ncbi:MAG TPA: hypothetical protein VMZ11_01915 [Mycobacteriales bacterium]|nr:hypothetical protein [Mycobacteriales bacterium]
MKELPYEDVPDPEPDSEPDPHWLELRKASQGRLPESYMPPAMGGHHAGWTRAASLLLIGIFLGATVCGVCLTYGVHL